MKELTAALRKSAVGDLLVRASYVAEEAHKRIRKAGADSLHDDLDWKEIAVDLHSIEMKLLRAKEEIEVAKRHADILAESKR